MTRISKDFRNRANAPLGRSLIHRVVVQDESLLQLATESIQSEIDVEVLEPTSSRRRHSALANGIGHIALSVATLSEYAVSRLGKRQKISNLNGMVKRWVESACG